MGVPELDLEPITALDEVPHDLACELYAAWTPPPDLTVSEWADRERRLSAEASAEPGRWRTSRAEYARDIMDACALPTIRTVVFMSSAQVGKTEILLNIIGYHMDLDPAPIMTLQPNVKPMAETFSKDRIAPMVRDTPALKGRVADAKSRDSGNTILHKTFPGGHLTIVGANAASGLASRPIRIVLADEVDRYPPSAGPEGDPVTLARKRATTFWNRLTVMTSTPTVKGASRIEREFELSDKRRFFVPCPHCGHMQHLRWARALWPPGEPRKARYGCEACDALLTDVEVNRAVSRGEWRATALFECKQCGQTTDEKPTEKCDGYTKKSKGGRLEPCEAPPEDSVPFEFKGRAGFHLNEIYSPWVTMAEMAEGFVEAKDDPEALKAWINTSLGETWEETGTGVDEAELDHLIEAYTVDSLPADICLVTAAVDVQGDRLEARSQGWGVKRERWNIEKRIFWGDPAEDAVWDDLDAWLRTVYQAGPYRLPISCTCVDSGGHHTDEVYRFCKPRQGRRVFAIKGSNQYYPPIASNPQQVGNIRAMLYSIGTDTAKDSILLRSLKREKPGPGYIHFPADTDKNDLKQFEAEEKVVRLVRGQPQSVWVQKKERNEEIDLHVYNLAAYVILRPDIAAILRKRAPADEPEPEVPARSTQRRRPPRKRKNWATDF